MTEEATFTVFPPRTRNWRADTPYMLVRDAWDDFGFKTQYALLRSHDSSLIGRVKILQKAQPETRDGVLADGPLGPLGPDFCSLGQDLDYYERVAGLGMAERDILMRALRDVVADPWHATGFEGEEGWRTSLWRDIEDEVGYRQVASVLLTGDYDALPDLDLDLSFKATGWSQPLRLNFSATAEGDQAFDTWGGSGSRHRLPRRVAVLTGRNGSGKSTLLARLARILHASQADRRSSAMASLGVLEPGGIGFTRIVTVSYSAFDSFVVPGSSADERRQIAKDLETGSGRYIFCGLRDIGGELQAELDLAESRQSDQPPSSDRRPTTLLKPIDRLASEFETIVRRIETEGRWSSLETAASLMLDDPSFADMGFEPDGVQDLERLLGDDPSGSFMAWSTGHKIAFHLLVSLVAHIVPRSMVLIDEPETHLHPPLLAALMHSVRYILEDRNSFAICATHSPVVAQETLARHIHVVRRSGEEASILPTKIETFGESIGEITDEVFGLNAEAMDYHRILKALLRRRGSIEEVERLFEHGLSLQARAYLMTLAASDQP